MILHPGVGTQSGCTLAGADGEEDSERSRSMLMRIPAAVVSPHPACQISSPESAALTGSLSRRLFLLMLSAATFSSDKGLGQVMKDISQNPLYASSYKYLAFLGPRCLPGTDTFLGSLPALLCGQAGMFLWVNAKILPGGQKKCQKHSSY